MSVYGQYIKVKE